MSNLSGKRERFCREYIIDCNGTQAAIRAGYSEKTANPQSARLLVNVSIKKRIKELQDEAFDSLGIDARYVLKRHVEIDQMDAADIHEIDGSIKPIHEWPKVWRQYLSGMDIAELWEGRGDEKAQIGILKKIKWPDKVKNLELLGKHVEIQAYKEKIDLGSSDVLVPFSSIKSGVDK